MSETVAAAAPAAQLERFLSEFEPVIVERARTVLERLRALVPGGFSASERPSEAVLSIAIFPRKVVLCFLQGVSLPDPDHLLRGGGNQVRSLELTTPQVLERPAVRLLVREALMRSVVEFDPSLPNRLVIRSISAKRRPRRPR